ncbi:Trm112 family protein [Geodermatophilus sp. SYSU D01036]
MTQGTTQGPLGSGPLGLDPLLLEVLACPDTHHTPLTVDEAASELVCPTCDRAFPVRDGIPVLLLDEARTRGGGGTAGR